MPKRSDSTGQSPTVADRLFVDGYLASLYDAWCPRQERWDFGFYLPLIMAAESVLDIGCGTGALLREARAAGHPGRLCGLDPADGMLQQARQQSDIEWVLGEASSAAWDPEFDLVVMTGHAFQVLVEDAELRASLAAIRASLIDDGCFAFETRNPAARGWEAWSQQYAQQVSDADGIVVSISTPVGCSARPSTATSSGFRTSVPRLDTAGFRRRRR